MMLQKRELGQSEEEERKTKGKETSLLIIAEQM